MGDYFSSFQIFLGSSSGKENGVEMFLSFNLTSLSFPHQ